MKLAELNSRIEEIDKIKIQAEKDGKLAKLAKLAFNLYCLKLAGWKLWHSIEIASFSPKSSKSRL